MTIGAHAVPEQKESKPENKGLGQPPFLYQEGPAKTEKPLTFREEPYTVEYFKLVDYKILKQNPELDKENILEKIGIIERYISGQIQRKGLLNESKTYNKIIEDLAKKLKIDLLIGNPRQTFLKVARYIRKYHWKK